MWIATLHFGPYWARQRSPIRSIGWSCQPQIWYSHFIIKSQVTDGNSWTDRIVASLDLEGITNNYKTWNHLTVCKQMNSILFRCHLQRIGLKNKIKITDKLISHISCIFIWMCAGKWLMLNCCWCIAVFKTFWLCKQIRWIEWFI